MTDKDPRLQELKTKIETVKKVENKKNEIHQKNLDDNDDKSQGLRAGAELITSIAAGAIIGYWLDDWLGTKPFLLIVMLILGIITGFVNVWRTTQNMGYQVGYKDVQKNNENEKKNID